MGFFFNEDKASQRDNPQATKRLPSARNGGHIPIATMQQMGCRACPSDKDGDLRHPKLDPVGPERPEVLVLFGAPSVTDDARGDYCTSGMGREVEDLFRAAGIKAAYFSVVRCLPAGDSGPGVQALACCRGHIEREIEAMRPRLVVTVGDVALQWAKAFDKSPTASTWRGVFMVARLGTHNCWLMPMMEPRYAEAKKRKPWNEFEFTAQHDVRLVADWLKAPPAPPQVVTSGYDAGLVLITGQEAGDMGRLEDELHKLLHRDSGVDLETSGLRPFTLPDRHWGHRQPSIWTAAVGTFERTVCFPLMHPAGWGTQARIQAAMGLFGEYLRESGPKVAHNAGFELEWLLYFYGPLVLRCTDWDDTMAMWHSINESEGTKSLDAQTQVHFGFNVKDQSNVDASNDLLKYRLPDLLRYNGMDTKWTHGLKPVLQARMQQEGKHALQEYARTMRLAPTLVLTQAKGVPYDRQFCRNYRDELVAKQVALERQVRETPEVREYTRKHGTFSPTNPAHVLVLLKDICRRDEVRVEDWAGNVSYTTDDDHLELIGAKVPAVPMIQAMRGAEKVIGTYVGPLADGKYECRDHHLHTTYNSMVAVTGRLSSNDPNLQNIPVRTAIGRRVRHALMALHGQFIAALDYGQIEARVIGMASEDQNLLRYQWSDYDIHGHWATRIHALYPKVVDWVVETFEVDWDEKGLKTLRQEAKNKWVFPQFFGARFESCAKSLHLPEDVAEELAAEFWDDFGGVKKWQAKVIKKYERNLYVEMLGGRRMHGPKTKEQIINGTAQGTAADIVTAAMSELSEDAFLLDDPELQSNLNIHDDLTHWLQDSSQHHPLLTHWLANPKDKATIDQWWAASPGADKVRRIVRTMCKPRFNYIITPILVEVKVGTRWDELHELPYKFRSDELYNTPNPFGADNGRTSTQRTTRNH